MITCDPHTFLGWGSRFARQEQWGMRFSFFFQKMLIFAEFYTFSFEVGPAHSPLIAGSRQRAGPPAAPLRAATRQAAAPARAAALRRPRPQRRALHGRAGVQGCGGGALPAAF